MTVSIPRVMQLGTPRISQPALVELAMAPSIRDLHVHSYQNELWLSWVELLSIEEARQGYEPVMQPFYWVVSGEEAEHVCGGPCVYVDSWLTTMGGFWHLFRPVTQAHQQPEPEPKTKTKTLTLRPGDAKRLIAALTMLDACTNPADVGELAKIDTLIDRIEVAAGKT